MIMMVCTIQIFLISHLVGQGRFLSADQIYTGGSLIRSLIANLTANISANVTKNASEPEKGGLSTLNLIIVIFTIMLSAYSNGVNIGVMGLDVQQLELMSKGPYETE